VQVSIVKGDNWLWNKAEAELFRITLELSEVVTCWASLDDYVGKLTIKDSMEPKAYAKLLFDDENFTRSRKYFWVIGCLGELDVSIMELNGGIYTTRSMSNKYLIRQTFPTC
jgi:hypothetical protein